MKKYLRLACALLSLLPAPLAAACAPYDYSARISEVRSDLFLAETEAFTLTVACVSREYPYADDGIPCPMTDTLEASLAPKGDAPAAVEIYADGTGWGGEASFSAVYGEYRFSEGVSAFPEGTLSLRVVWGEEEISLAATSVRTEQTLTPEEALAAFTAAEKETLKRMQKEGAFCGELCIRLLRRDKNYYYAAVTDGTERTALLLDGETGEVLARRTDVL